MASITDSTPGDDYLDGTPYDDLIAGGAGNDRIAGHRGDDTLKGEAGDDVLGDDSGNDLLLGGEGNDSLYIGARGYDQVGSSTAKGGAGDDLLVVRVCSEGHVLTGGSGADVFSFNDDFYNGQPQVIASFVSAPVVITDFDATEGDRMDLGSYFRLPGEEIGEAALFRGVAPEGFQAKVGQTVPGANYGSEVLQLWTFEQNGRTVLFADFDRDFVVDKKDVRLEFDGAPTLTEDDFDGTFDAIVGTPGDDSLNGNADDDRIEVLGGDDTIAAGGGSDTVRGGKGDDLIKMGSADEAYDLINFAYGDGGDDTLKGGGGHDFLDGGSGNDTYVVNGNDQIIEVSTLATEIDSVQSSVTRWFEDYQYIENLTLTGSAAINGTGNQLANAMTGNSGANSLAGAGGNDTLDGGAGKDTLIGGAGNDTYVVDVASDVISETSTIATEIDKVKSVITWTLGANLEKLTLTGDNDIKGTGNSLANAITGNSGANSLKGGSGKDTIDGGLGKDTLDGGSGNDTYIVDLATDVIVENSTSASELDRVQSVITWTLGANLESLTLTGSSAIGGTGNSLANLITGNSAANSLKGGSGKDTLDGGAGKDTLSGGAGNDTYVVDVANDVISETGTTASEIDSVKSSATWTLGANLEGLTLTGSSAISGTGNSLANLIIGNSAANVLNGGSGKDTLDGGAGQDTLKGGTGNDTYVVDLANDVISETSTTAIEFDTVQSAISWTLGAHLELLTLTGSKAISGTGNSLANRITGNSGDNLLDGGSGKDTLVGGAGEDTYVVNVATDLISEDGNDDDELDSVESSVSWTLGANLEVLTLTGTGAINGTGNTLGNLMAGNDGANALKGDAGRDGIEGGKGNDLIDGGAGDDVMWGGAGHDTLIGGTGYDGFYFNNAPSSGSHADQISDFKSAVDVLVLDSEGFTKLTSDGRMSYANFVPSSTGTAVDANDYILYDTDSGQLFYDADGSGAGARLWFATLPVGTVLYASDILIV